MPKRKPKPKEEPKESPSVSAAISLTPMSGAIRVLNSVSELIRNQEALNEMVMYCSQGASIDTVEMALGIAEGQLKQWLNNGRMDKDGDFHTLYLFYSKINANTRLMAETALLAKNPDKWLATIEFKNQLQTSQSANTAPVIQGNVVSKPDSVIPTTKVENGLTYLDDDSLSFPEDNRKKQNDNQEN